MDTLTNCDDGKITEHIKVNSLRVIPCMEVDFNQLHKLIFGLQMIKQLEGYNRIPDETYGSITNLIQTLVVVNRRLVIDNFSTKTTIWSNSGS